jgi:hypothetical protein
MNSRYHLHLLFRFVVILLCARVFNRDSWYIVMLLKVCIIGKRKGIFWLPETCLCY